MTSHDTSEISFELFTAHGSINFTLQDQHVLLFQSVGPFNEEIVNALEATQNAPLHELKATVGYWSDVVILEGSCCATPDALLALTSYIKTLKNEGLNPIASAYVFLPEVEGASMMPPFYQKCYNDAGLTYGSFDNKAEAVTWVKEQMLDKMR